MGSRLRSHPLSWIMILGAVTRAMKIMRRPGTFDERYNYFPIARSLASGQRFVFKGRPTAYRPPLYPLILVPAVCLGRWQPLGIAISHLGLGAATVWMTATAASGFGWSRRRALAA